MSKVLSSDKVAYTLGEYHFTTEVEACTIKVELYDITVFSLEEGLDIMLPTHSSKINEHRNWVKDYIETHTSNEIKLNLEQDYEKYSLEL